MAVRRPGWFLCREVTEMASRVSKLKLHAGSFIPDGIVSPSLSVGGLWAVLSETSAGRARGPSVCCCEGKRRHRDPGLQTALRWGHLHWWRGEQIPPPSCLSVWPWGQIKQFHSFSNLSSTNSSCLRKTKTDISTTQLLSVSFNLQNIILGGGSAKNWSPNVFNCLFIETLLWPAAEEDGGGGLHSPRSVAELYPGVEVWLPGQHERRGLHLGGSVCHRSRRTGSALGDHLDSMGDATCQCFKRLFCLQGILLEHREKEFGDKVQIGDVLEAVKKIVPVK